MGLTDSELIENLKASVTFHKTMLELSREERFALEIDRDCYRSITRALWALVAVMWACLLLA